MDDDGVEIVHMKGSQVIFTDSDDDDISVRFGAQMFTGAQLLDSSKTTDTMPKEQVDPQGEFFNKMHFNQARMLNPSVGHPEGVPKSSLIGASPSVLGTLGDAP
mmetsp:Transcript_26276/g.40119  ORF Transcript_26276/g.40119 Transcript_26276/m.40119 type:complete len:104 (+) Transcript_26276:626-937(+)